MICCDTCPYWPTCEEVEDFERDVLRLHEEWGDDGHSEPAQPGEYPGDDWPDRGAMETAP